MEEDGRFRLIVITRLERVDNEAEKITGLLRLGIDRVHIRKPDEGPESVRELLREIPKVYYPRLTLHQWPELLERFPERLRPGFHLNRRFGEVPEKVRMVSKSCHSLAEAREAALDPRISYQTLSPIFDSISKTGYKSGFDLQNIGEIPPGTIALGGMTPESIRPVRERGFAGAAFLGYVWDRIGEDGNFDVVRELIEAARG